MKHFLQETDFSRDEVAQIFTLARRFKQERGRHEKPLAGQTWAMIFAKSSTRTRVSFEVGIHELGVARMGNDPKTSVLNQFQQSHDVKNLFVMAPMFFHKDLFGTAATGDPTLNLKVAGKAFVATAVFCLLAGAVYTMNDLVDVEADRVHPVKRERPIASGAVPESVAKAFAAFLVVVALGQPLAGYVFVVDGVLIGAGDGRWLAGAMAATLVLYAPLAVWVHLAGNGLMDRGAPYAVTVLWVVFTAFMAIRAVFFWWRVRSDAWAVTGASR